MPRLRRARTRRDDALREGLEVVSPNSDAKLEILEVPPRGSRDPLRVKRVLKPNMGEAPPHVHLDFAEEFAVESGVADAKLDDLELRLTAQPGRAKLYVPAGVPHVNPYNRDIVDLVVVQSFQPATEGARSYIRTLAEMFRDGRDDDGDLPWSLVLAIGHATRDRTYFSGVPFSFQRRVLLPLGNVVAGTRGYSVYIPREPRA